MLLAQKCSLYLAMGGMHERKPGNPNSGRVWRQVQQVLAYITRKSQSVLVSTVPMILATLD